MKEASAATRAQVATSAITTTISCAPAVGEPRDHLAEGAGPLLDDGPPQKQNDTEAGTDTGGPFK